MKIMDYSSFFKDKQIDNIIKLRRDENMNMDLPYSHSPNLCMRLLDELYKEYKTIPRIEANKVKKDGRLLFRMYFPFPKDVYIEIDDKIPSVSWCRAICILWLNATSNKEKS